MTKTQTYLCRLIVQGSLVWAASVAAMSAQTTGSNASQAFTAASVNPIGVKGEFTGDVGCRNCHKHDKIWNSFYKNPHFKSVASGEEPPERTGCEGAMAHSKRTWLANASASRNCLWSSSVPGMGLLEADRDRIDRSERGAPTCRGPASTSASVGSGKAACAPSATLLDRAHRPRKVILRSTPTQPC
jgi:hypothetical protein